MYGSHIIYRQEETGKYGEALDILSWVVEHSQRGLLPEALDPKYLNPLPTTSPLTWSSAMFVIVSLNYRPQSKGFNSAVYIIALAVIVAAVTLKKLRGRFRL